MILLVSLSRIVLGLHSPIDILAGWLLGALLVWAVLRFEQPLLSLLRRRHFTDQAVILFAVSLAVILVGALTRLVLGSWTVPTGWIELAARAPEAQPINPL